MLHRVLSGSFDQTVGIWSQDGQLIHRLGPFTGNITALCYVATVGIVWIASGTSQPTIYEPQSGEIVSQFISTFRGQQMEGLVLQQLLSLPDSRHVIGSAKPQQMLVWRYSELGCLTVLPCKHPLECLAYAKKEPVLLFSGDSSGMLQKWERSYISPFIYSMESFHISEAQLERRGPFAQQMVKSGKEEPQPRPCSPRKWRKAYSGRQSGHSLFRTTAKDTQKESIGFTRAIFAEELDILVVSATNGKIYLWEFESFNPGTESPGQLSGGWDGRLCLWDLQNRSLQNELSSVPGNNGPILDMAYSPKRREFALSSSTGRIFICAFNPHCANLVLLAELGHQASVVALVWHSLEDKWVSGSEDGSIRLWSEDGGCCMKVLRAPRGITCLCIDQANGCIVAGVHDTIRVYDANSGVQVQSHTGHQDTIKGLIHVPEMEQYVSVSLDGTVCMWKAYRQGD
uniref:uncharacterized protein LOC130475560 n=1 Tax=Euleptes europaea TaxID=460621 RepID=UPI0025405563|nr:uncharacterized protein LOC130475560 [Euleptes europaea]